jgi:hypothetical protein
MMLNRGSNLLFRQSNDETTAAAKMSPKCSNGTVSHFWENYACQRIASSTPSYQGIQRPAICNYPPRRQDAQAGGGRSGFPV